MKRRILLLLYDRIADTTPTPVVPSCKQTKELQTPSHNTDHTDSLALFAYISRTAGRWLKNPDQPGETGRRKTRDRGKGPRGAKKA